MVYLISPAGEEPEDTPSPPTPEEVNIMVEQLRQNARAQTQRSQRASNPSMTSGHARRSSMFDESTVWVGSSSLVKRFDKTVSILAF